MSLLPDRLPTSNHSNRQLAELMRALQNGELEVARHAIASRIQVEKDHIDAQAAADASLATFSTEVMFERMGMGMVTSDTDVETLREHYMLLKAMNAQRLHRRFGS